MYLHLVAAPSSASLRADGGGWPARRLVVVGVADGEARLTWRRRTLRVDADACCVLDADADDVVVRVDRGAAVSRLCIEPGDSAAPPIDPAVVGHLLANDDVARACWRRVGAGADAATGPDRHALAEAAARTGAALRRRAELLPCARPTTRDSLLERILCAADFIAAHYDEPIGLDEMAGAASLSRFHFVRLFRSVHGETPHGYLVRKRAAVARRRLACGDDLAEAASRAGFGSRSSLFRGLRRVGAGPVRQPEAACCPSA